MLVAGSSFTKRLLNIAGNSAKSALRTAFKELSRRATTPQRRTPPGTVPGRPQGHQQAYYRDPAKPLPHFVYRPRTNNHEPDPGEVVWTWVPYEEDDSRGKDRPVLVLAYGSEGVIAAQLTSQDHHRDAQQEAHWGRYWLDIGTGEWDSRRRPSQVRLDHLLVVPPESMRREGGKLGREMFEKVCRAIETLKQ
ncbi:MAG: type II toxin-antitoxin system PemK/MazF family toxin [Actinomycetaceae bacterium]|nr:type II toxin-antitoxin system PemK/MazF family toxin [Actinomycetaceae bacterium]